MSKEEFFASAREQIRSGLRRKHTSDEVEEIVDLSIRAFEEAEDAVQRVCMRARNPDLELRVMFYAYQLIAQTMLLRLERCSREDVLPGGGAS